MAQILILSRFTRYCAIGNRYDWWDRMQFGKLIKPVLAGVIVSAVAVSASMAQTPTKIKQFNAWGAYSYKSSGSKVCYVLSIPTKKEPADRDHGDIFFLVSQKPGQNVSYEPQVEVGYPFKEGSNVIVDIDGKSFSMFTKGRNAWVENAAQEPALVKAMRAGRSMSVSGKSRRGTGTSYTYSLSGITAALNEIGKCK